MPPSSRSRHTLQPSGPALAAAADSAQKSPQTYSISELAQAFDVTPRAIRFYEDLGLLNPTRLGLQRVYSQRDLTRLKLTLRGKRLGLSLQNVKRLVDMYESGGDSRPQLEAFLQALAAQRQQLERQLEDLQLTLVEIAQHEARCREWLEQTPGPEPDGQGPGSGS